MSDIKLTIDEVIEHCDRRVKQYSHIINMDEVLENLGKNTPLTKEYLEHKQVAEWLRELKQLRDFKQEILQKFEGLRDEYSVEWECNYDLEDYNRLCAFEKAIEIVKGVGN